MIEISQYNPVSRIRTVNFKPRYRIHIWSQLRKECSQFSNVLLAIAVRVEDQVFDRVIKSTLQCCAVTEIAGMPNHPQSGKLFTEKFQDLRSCVGAPIIHHNNFKILR